MDETKTNVTANEATNDVAQATPKAEPSTKTDEKPTTHSANVEEQLQALMVENAKMRRAMERANSEAADYKKKYNATLSEQEKASQEKAEEQARRDERLAELERENSIHKFTEQFLDLGYDKASAVQAATAQVDNDVDTLFKLQKKIIDDKVMAKEQELYKSIPRAKTGVYASMTKEQIMAIPDREERRRAMAENFELFE
jgi:hypothetical protein